MILDPRGGEAGLLAQIAAPAAPAGDGPEPSAAALKAAAAAIQQARTDWSRSARAIGRIARDRSLGSRHRRAAVDLAWHVVRGRRLLDVLVGAPDGDAPARRLAEAAAVLFAGAPGETIRDSGARDGVLDPRHALLGHVLATGIAPETALGVAASLPDWFAAELLRDREPEDAASLARALLDRAPLTLRALRHRADRDAVTAALAADGIEAASSPLAPDALVLGRHANVQSLQAHKDGLIAVQDAGSQVLAGLAVGPKILDACAGAGGKALAIASTGDVRVLACDVRRDALQEAGKRARFEGVERRVRTQVLPKDGLPASIRAFGPVDTVLIDAPCTGSGSLRREPAMRWARSPLDVTRLPTLQGRLLDRFAPLVAPGARLVYATCSLFGVENDAVVRAFLDRSPGFDVVPVHDLLPASAQEVVAPAPDGFLRLRPDRHGCDGFFAAVLLRR